MMAIGHQNQSTRKNQLDKKIIILSKYIYQAKNSPQRAQPDRHGRIIPLQSKYFKKTKLGLISLLDTFQINIYIYIYNDSLIDRKDFIIYKKQFILMDIVKKRDVNPDTFHDFFYPVLTITFL
jgi:hypothetical protein